MSFIYALSDNRWSNAGTTYRGIWMDFTNGAGGSAVGAATSRPFRLSNNGTDFFGVDLNGSAYLGLGAGLFFQTTVAGSAAIAITDQGGASTWIWSFGGNNSPFSVYYTEGPVVRRDYALAWANDPNSSAAGSRDTKLSRRMAAIVSINGAFAFPSLTLASLSASVATAASAGAGATAYISDATTSTGYRATAAGGGSTPQMVYSDGTQWRNG